MGKEFQLRRLYLQHFQTDHLEAPPLKPLDDLANKATLNSIWLHNYQSPLCLVCKI